MTRSTPQVFTAREDAADRHGEGGAFGELRAVEVYTAEHRAKDAERNLDAVVGVQEREVLVDALVLPGEHRDESRLNHAHRAVEQGGQEGPRRARDDADGGADGRADACAATPNAADRAVALAHALADCAASMQWISDSSPLHASVTDDRNFR